MVNWLATSGDFAPRPTGRPRFYTAMAGMALIVSITGFAGTFFLPLAEGRFEAPPVIFLHGGLLFSWILLFLVQPGLVRFGAYGAHKALGVLGAILAVGIVVSGVAVGVYAVQRDVAAGGGETAVSTLVGICTAMAIFLALVGAGVSLRHRPEVHKRLMLLATLAILWPAWFRLRHYFPNVPRPDFWFALVAADSMFLVCMIRDRIALGRVHPVYLWVGCAIILENLLELLLFDSPPWRAVANALYAVLA
jgi:hypothetical protein